MGKYFYNEDSSIKQIHKLEKDYRDISQAILDIDQCVANNVCQNRMWFDDNAIVFLKWWNDNGKDDDNNVCGNLKWDDSQKMLVSNTKDVTSDGVDRLVKILNRGGKCFYIAVCKSLAALESSHKDVKNKCNRYLKVAHDKNYSLEATKGNAWGLLMQDLIGAVVNFDWNISVPANSNGKTTSLTQVKNFKKEMEKGLNKLDECVETYCTDIEALVNNTDSSKWWGFSDDVRSKIKKAVKSYRTSSTRKMKNFKKNLNLAVSKTIEAKGEDLKSVMALSDVNFDN